MDTRASALLACLLAAACATPQGDYPSLAVRDAERVTGTLQPAEPAPLPQPPASAIASVDGLLKQASAAYETFRGKLERSKSAALAGRGADEGSDAWAGASVALADLETERSRTMLPLADLDRLVVDASTEGSSTAGLAEAQAQVEQMVDFETEQIDAIHSALGR